MMESLRKKFKLEDDYLSDDDYSYDCYEDEQAPSDYYCIDCKATMNSLATWQMHVSGKKHQKTVAKASYGNQRRMNAVPGSVMETVNISGAGPTKILLCDRDEVAQMQQSFEEMDEAIVGLDHVKEIWLQDSRSEPLYKCTLCGSGCQVPTIRNHVAGYRHRLAYIKDMDPQEYKYFSKLDEKTSVRSQAVARFARRLQDKYGMGKIKVQDEVGGEDSWNGAETHRGGSGSSRLKEEMEVKSMPVEEIIGDFFDYENKNRAKALDLYALPKCPVAQEQSLNRMQVVNFFVGEKLKTLSNKEKTDIIEDIAKCNFGSFRRTFQFDRLLSAVSTIEKIHSASK